MQTKAAVALGICLILAVLIFCGSWLRITTVNAAEQKASVRFAHEHSDAADRYQLKDMRHGNIVGLALLDKQIGRVWLLTSITDKKGKKVRDSFQELHVQDLWETEETLWEERRVYVVAGSDEAQAEALKAYSRYVSMWHEIKMRSRPSLVTKAVSRVEAEQQLLRKYSEEDTEKQGMFGPEDIVKEKP